LGAAVHFAKEDISLEDIENSKILHLEAYQLEDESLRKAVFSAIEIAKKNGVLISMDLSDSGLVLRNKDFFKEFVSENVDVLFSNEDEAKAFTDKEGRDALDSIYEMCKLAVVKLGSKGSLIKYKDKVHEILPFKVDAVNTNGAGDTYAAGILYGLANDLDIDKAGELASYAASLVVSNSGARLEHDQRSEVKLLNGRN